ncbi:hypothetical protein OF83DRAFT_541926 [Amylostereum chailletii]|nr:hypothetical protein OF83DRAFT_541926 [Amylostereum chailletii]
MPRRPQSASRNGPSASSPSSPETLSQPHPSHDHHSGESSGSSSSQPHSDVGTDDEEDVDAPRVAQWLDEDDLDESDQSEGEEDDGRLQDVKSLEDGLQSLPFGALRKARRALAATTVDSDSDDASDSEGSITQGEATPNKQETSYATGSNEVVPKPKKILTKRSSKHAPTEVTSKRPVSRRRTIVEVPKMEVRDPRFLPMSGDFDAKRFRERYGFIADLHKDEMKTLRDNLKRARKLLSSSPKDLRPEREQEVERLERAVKRAESSVNRDKREKIEQEALSQVSREEREKRKQGKGAYYMKNAEKKSLLLKARYDAMAAEGGRKAVKKAIEKKQKKISQKETKSRPFARPNGTDDSGSSKRRFSNGDGGDSGVHRNNKRRKVE